MAEKNENEERLHYTLIPNVADWIPFLAWIEIWSSSSKDFENNEMKSI